MLKLLLSGIKRSWPWSVGAIVFIIAFLFGDIQGYLKIIDVISSNKWALYILLIFPPLCVILIGLVKVLSENLLEKTAKGDTIDKPLFKRLHLETSRKIDLDGLVSTYTKTEVESIFETPLHSIRHKRSVYETGKFSDFHFEFIPIQRTNNGTITHRLVYQTNSIIIWEVIFTPPLTMGERASYAFSQTTFGPHAVYLEQIHEKLTSGFLVRDFDHWRKTMKSPTDKLIMRLEFPKNYEISLPDSSGFRVYSRESVAEEETIRLRNEKSFSAKKDILTGQWQLELIVQKAKAGLSYSLEWIPPRRPKMD